MMFSKSAWLLLSIASVASPAFATPEDTYPERQFGAWSVYGWDDDCWLKTTKPDGTELLLSTEAKSDQLYVVARNAGWLSIKDESTYPIRVMFGEVDIVGTGYGSSGTTDLEPGIGVFLKPAARPYFPALRTSASVRLSLDGKVIVEAARPDIAAIDYLEACTVAIRSQAKRAEDPFAKRPTVDDPFKAR